MVFIGIDPGSKPAYSIIKEDGEIIIGLSNSLQEFQEIISPYLTENAIVTIEKVWSMPMDGHMGAFKFGYSVGYIDCIFENGGVKKICKVAPQVWKKYFNILKKSGGLRDTDKTPSINAAYQINKNINLLPTPRCKKPNHNMAEAFLIACYGKDNWSCL